MRLPGKRELELIRPIAKSVLFFLLLTLLLGLPTLIQAAVGGEYFRNS